MLSGKSCRFAIAGLVAGLGACTTWTPVGNVGDGELEGRLFVEWVKEDGFIYRQKENPLSFKPSFMRTAIVPRDMYTTGGSVPRVFWSIPGLSPWGLGPAYIVHDWIFEVHRCDRDEAPEIKAITFDQSATILAEVGKSLIDAKLIQHDMLDAIVWGVKTRYARDLWETPGSEEDCRTPPAFTIATRARLGVETVVDFEIPPPSDR